MGADCETRLQVKAKRRKKKQLIDTDYSQILFQIKIKLLMSNY